MPHPFEIRKEIEVDATAEQVWEAIATGKGIDGWFFGTNNEVEPGEGGRVHIDFGDESGGDATITAWDPPRRLAYRDNEAAPDGALHAFEYVIEGGAGGRTLVRFVHSGFLGGDWEAEVDALNEGDFMYLHQMAQYVTYFRGRRPTVVTAFRQYDPAGRDRALAALRAALGVGASGGEGERVSTALDGGDRIEGVVDFASPSILGVRTDDALYRFLHAPQGVVHMGHHIYREGIDRDATTRAWEAWLERAIA
jgi:uncharacterized protein YndB with AHSA1/START domain